MSATPGWLPEEWVYLGERLLQNGKLGHVYRRPDDTRYTLAKPLVGRLSIGSVLKVTMTETGGVYNGGPNRAVYLRTIDADAPGIRQALAEQEEARQRHREAQAVKKAAADAHDLGDMTLREIRKRIDGSFGNTRAGWITSVVSYLMGAIK